MRTLLLGECLVDLVCEQPVASLTEATSFVPHFGGAVANVAVVAARRGARVALAGGAGDDAWGAWLRERLEAENVDLSWWRLVDGEQTPLATDRFASYGDARAVAAAAVEPQLAEAIASCDALLLRASLGEIAVRARELALADDRPLILDASVGDVHAASEARALVDGALLVVAEAEDARLLTGERDPGAAAQSLVAGGARNAIVRDDDGAVLRGVASLDVRLASVADATFVGVVLSRLAATGYYEPAIAAALGDAIA